MSFQHDSRLVCFLYSDSVRTLLIVYCVPVKLPTHTMSKVKAMSSSSSSSSRSATTITTTTSISAPSSSANSSSISSSSSPLSSQPSLSLSLSRDVYAKIYLHAAKHFDCPVMGYLIGGRIIDSSATSTEGATAVEDAPSVVIANYGSSSISGISSSSSIFISDMLPIGHSYPAGPILQIAGEIVRSILYSTSVSAVVHVSYIVDSSMSATVYLSVCI